MVASSRTLVRLFLAVGMASPGCAVADEALNRIQNYSAVNTVGNLYIPNGIGNQAFVVVSGTLRVRGKIGDNVTIIARDVEFESAGHRFRVTASGTVKGGDIGDDADIKAGSDLTFVSAGMNAGLAGRNVKGDEVDENTSVYATGETDVGYIASQGQVQSSGPVRARKAGSNVTIISGGDVKIAETVGDYANISASGNIEINAGVPLEDKNPNSCLRSWQDVAGQRPSVGRGADLKSDGYIIAHSVQMPSSLSAAKDSIIHARPQMPSTPKGRNGSAGFPQAITVCDVNFSMAK